MESVWYGKFIWVFFDTFTKVRTCGHGQHPGRMPTWHCKGWLGGGWEGGHFYVFSFFMFQSILNIFWAFEKNLLFSRMGGKNLCEIYHMILRYFAHFLVKFWIMSLGKQNWQLEINLFWLTLEYWILISISTIHIIKDWCPQLRFTP